jgi:4-aminobutyrate aminotransferase
MNDKVASPDFRSEGDLNATPNRQQWQTTLDHKKASNTIQRDAAVFFHQSLSTPCLDSIEKAKGTLITTEDGREMLDFHGNYVHNLGFSHPAVVQALKNQLDELSFCTRRYTNQKTVELAEKLVGYSKGELSRVLFAPGGAEAMSMAMKIARMHTGRFKTISLWDSFHGATLDTISIGGEAIFRNQIGPLLTGQEHAPPPNPSSCPFNCGQSCNLQCANYIEYILEKEGDICAVIAETIRSTPFIPPKDYWKKVRQACDKHGALLILDEIPHALGRTGRMFTFQHYGITPDMVVLGKGLGAGIVPFAAVLGKEELNESISERAIGHFTHEKSPIASAAALAMLEVIEKEHLLEHVVQMESYIAQEYFPQLREISWVHDTRILGLMIGIELRDPSTKEKAVDLAEKVMYTCMTNGLNFKLSMGSTINLTPPMSVSKAEIDQAFTIISNALNDIA